MVGQVGLTSLWRGLSKTGDRTNQSVESPGKQLISGYAKFSAAACRWVRPSSGRIWAGCHSVNQQSPDCKSTVLLPQQLQTMGPSITANYTTPVCTEPQECVCGVWRHGELNIGKLIDITGARQLYTSCIDVHYCAKVWGDLEMSGFYKVKLIRNTV